MLRSPVAWLVVLSIGILIHVDWHLGRPGHDHLSFGLLYHWLLAVVTFAPLPWLVVRRWPTAFPQASVVVVFLGVALGQGLEPLGEVIHFPVGWEPFTNPVRWRVFAEFIVAGVVTYLASAGLAVRRFKARRGLTSA